MSNVTSMFVMLKKAVLRTYKGISFITGTFTNMRANDYSPENIIILSPYGHGSFPVNGLKGMLIPDQDSGKNAYYCAGFSSNFPPISYTFQQGESWNFSQNYVLVCQNNGLITYRINDTAYQATLISGEWTNKILSDLIQDNNTYIRQYINNVIVPAFAGLGVTIPPIVVNTDLISDNTAISNKNTLITNTGTLP